MSKPPPAETPLLRPHIYDGIQEYDNRLPNWWLITLYGAIVYSVGYWVFYEQMDVAPTPERALQQEMKANQLLAAQNAGVISDEILWNMSRDANVVSAGKATFETMCASCHMPNLAGGIGPNLKDETWVHGNKPLDLVKVITTGVLEKGMPTWGPVLGGGKISEVTAYVLSYHPVAGK